MRKFLLVSTLLFALLATAQMNFTGGYFAITHGQDMKTLIKPRENTQQVFNVMDAMGRHFEFDRFQVNCLATTHDLQGLPEGARITGIALDGNNMGGDTTLTVSFYAQNTDLDNQEVDGLGFEHNPFPGNEYLVASDVQCFLPGDTARKTLFDVDFEPFTYEGNNVLITLDISLPEGDSVNFAFDMATAYASNAIVIRTEKYCINSLAALIPILMPDFEFEFNAQQLPAFTMRYFTNDIRGRALDAQGQPVEGLKWEVTDETLGVTYKRGLRIEDDGTFLFESTDPTHTYGVRIYGGEYDFKAEHLAFDEQGLGDIVLEVRLGDEPLLLGDITGDGLVDIADINAIINVMLYKASPEMLLGDPDITGDGNVDIADINACINLMLGKS